jgi:2-polyprenyl-6-methoxyphenol hydroxylase-like FAD-dependent oxidoreductase
MLLAADDGDHVFRPPNFGEVGMLFPQGRGRVRVYFATVRRAERGGLSGETRIDDFIRACIDCGVPADWFRAATASGPLASFETAASWVEHPCKNGVALVADAAAAIDPTYGAGQSLTLRDVRVLAELLQRETDWDVAAHQYADDHHRCFHVLHTVEQWMDEIYYTLRSEGDRIRAGHCQSCARASAPTTSPLDQTCQ